MIEPLGATDHRLSLLPSMNLLGFMLCDKSEAFELLYFISGSG